MRTASRTMKANLRWWLLGLVAAGCAACRPPEAEPRRAGKESSAMKRTSKAFEDGTTIPVQHTGDGADVSPPLQWGGAPPGTMGFALICDDPDAPMGTWVHWVIYGLPAAARELPEKVAQEESLPGGARQGVNGFRRVGYGGPPPPAARQAAPVLLQALRPRRRAPAQATGYQAGAAAGDGGPHPGPGAARGHLPAVSAACPCPTPAPIAARTRRTSACSLPGRGRSCSARPPSCPGC